MEFYDVSVPFIRKCCVLTIMYLAKNLSVFIHANVV